MAEIASAYVTIIPSFKGGASTISRELAGPMSAAGTTSGKTFGSKMRVAAIGPLKSLGGMIGGLFAAQKIGQFFGDAFKEAQEAQKVGAQTAAVLKSTGGAAKVSAKHIGDYATKLSLMSGIDDEAIQSGQNLLLTFTNVQNGVGKGNAIFDQATSIMTDMSAALGQDMKSSAIQLGKALNDPIKGVTALQRVGVSFTGQQKSQIKALVDSGNTMKAQKLILAELRKEFGGSAAAIATPADKAKVAWGNFKETVGTALMPTFNGLLSMLTTKVVPALSSTLAFVQKNSGAFKIAGMAVGGLVSALLLVKGVMGAVSLVTKTTAAATAAWSGITKAAGVVAKGFAIAQGALNVVMSANPIALVVIGLTALVAAIVVAWKQSEAFRNVVTAVWGAIKSVTLGAVNAVKNAVSSAWTWIKTTTAQIWNGIASFFSVKWTLISLGVRRFTAGVRSIFTGAWNGIRSVTSSIWNGIAGFFTNFWGGLRRGFSVTVDAIGKAWAGLKNLALKPVQFIIDVVYNNGIRKLWNKVTGIFGGPQLGALKFATGGAVPMLPGASPSRDSVLAALTPGEYVITRDGSNLEAALRHYGIPGYSNGGIVGALKGAGQFAMKVFTDPVGAVSGLLGSVVDRIPGLGGSQWAGIIKRIPRKIADELGSLAKRLVSKFIPKASGVGGAVSRWSPLVAQVLGMLGQPKSLVPWVLKLIEHESGGNPNAINLWDINAKNGIPSQGLMQTIPPTFNAYSGPFRSRGILDPLANIYAGLNYGIRRYGSVARIPGIAALMRGGGYQPYAKGGIIDKPTLALMGEAGPEAVVPLRRGAPGLGTTVNLTVNNPVAEPASRSKRAMVEAAYLAGVI